MADIRVPSLDSLAFAVKAILTAEKSVVGTAYAGLVAIVLRDGNFAQRGYAKDLISPLAAQIAEQRAGAKAWAALDAGMQGTLRDRASNTAKRYAEKAVGIAKQAADKGLSVTAVSEAESDKDAAAIVKAWLFENELFTQDALFEFFGFSKPNQGNKEPKAPSDKAPGTPENVAPQKALDADGEPVASADPFAAIAQHMGNVHDFVTLTRRVLDVMTPADRQLYANAMLAQIQALATPLQLVAA
jgi:hypothetical protein